MFEENQDLKFERCADGFFVRRKNAKNPFFLKRGDYFEELASLVEILKVEGWWNYGGAISVTNKSPELISLFDYLFGFHGIKTYKRVLIKVKIPKEPNTEKSITVLRNCEEIRFHFGRNGFTQELDHIVFTDYFEPASYNVRFGEKEISFETMVSGKDLATSTEDARIYAVLRANNKSFTTFIGSILGEKTISREIRISKFLKMSSPEVIAKVFARVVDCEGSIRFSGHTRNIHIRMINRQYLDDWRELLQTAGVNSHTANIDKGMAQMIVTCNQNFTKLKSLGFELFHKTKKERFQRIMDSYKKHQLRRNTALETYLDHVRANPKISALELSKRVNKGKGVVSHYLLRLKRTGKITAEPIGQKYLYSAIN